MAINRIAGQTLQSELLRDGENLAIQDTSLSTPVLYVDIANSRIGVNTDSPTSAIDINGNVTANNLTVTANISGGNVTATANISGGNVTATANISGGNLLTSGLISASSNITGGNVNTSGLITATGNVTGGNVNTAGLITATGNITGGNITISSSLIAGNLSIIGNTISSINANGNIAIDPTGSGIFSIVGNNGFVMPYGNTAQRPGTPDTGTTRFNTALDVIETWNGTTWVEAGGGGGGGSVADQQITPDGTSTIYTLDQSATQGTILVSFNGVAQLPGVAYTVSGTSITFANAPETTDIIDIRFLAAATTNDKILNSSGNTFVQATDSSTIILTAADSNVVEVTSSSVNVSGLISASGNITGGNLNTSGKVVATGNITGGNLTTTGTANIGTLSVTGSGTIGTTLGVTANITGGNLITGGLVSATGNITSAGNITGGNILGGANVNATTHTGTTVSVTANITGGNLLTGGIVSATGNITGGNLLISGLTTVNTGNSVTAIENGAGNGVGNIGSSSKYFNTVFAVSTSALYADLAEYYLADTKYEPGTVLSFGGSAEVTQSQTDQDSAVVGVVSSNPAYKMNTGLVGEFVVPVALVGRVPCRVYGPVKRGDLLVATTNGYARAEKSPQPGTIVGKSIDNFNGEVGIVEILVGKS